MAKSKDSTPSVDPEVVATDGYYAAAETDDNSVATSDSGYIGVSPEYQNYANETDKPLRSEDEEAATVEEKAKEAEEANKVAAADVGFRGFAPEIVHPSEARGPASDYIDANRALMDKALGRDKEETTEEEAPASPFES